MPEDTNEPPRLGDEAVAPSAPSPLDRESLPPLLADSSFWGLTVTQFLGAFNDNLIKQTIFLLFVAVPIAGSFGKTEDWQSLATFTFSVPFILFSGFAGFLSDRYSKRQVIVLCKVAEILITLSGVAAYLALASPESMSRPLVYVFSAILFLMGTHSAFFGPAKYGILPEMLRDRDLATANGLVLMTTFLAIIFGSGLAGPLMDALQNRLWISGTIGVAIAVLGTCTALFIRRMEPAQKRLPFRFEALGIPKDVRHLLWADRPILAAILASTVFWGAASLALSAVNNFGKNQLLESNTKTSILVATISFGIVFGSLFAGFASRGKFNTRVLWVGLWGMILCLGLLSIPGPKEMRSHLLGYWGSMGVLMILGGFTGMFAVPLQVFVQSRAPAYCKGRVIATQNLFQWVGITASSGLYWGVGKLLEFMAWPQCFMFAFVALLMLGIAIVYRPRGDREIV